jgi:hypothetical protein
MRSKKLIQELESRFGVRPEFSGHLIPVLERVAEQKPSAGEWEEVLKGVAQAYHTSSDATAEVDALKEVCALMGQFSTELKKLDESLKVLGAYLGRIQQRMTAPAGSRVLH